jgi:sulfoxide reductase heme-binding subunit YedZ
MKGSAEPLNYFWWLAARASGVVALVLISISVVMGLAMAARALTRPRLKRAVAKLHEHVALTALGAIGLHGLALLEDPWLKPGWRGIAVPFALSYRPFFTGVGIIAAYAAVLLGPSFYLRRRIGVRRWRKLHSLLVLVWIVSGVHTLGAGSDGRKLWLEAVVAAPVVPIVYLLVLRALKSGEGVTSRTPRQGATPAPAADPPAEVPQDRRHARLAAADAAGA